MNPPPEPADNLPERAWQAYLFQEVTTPLVALLDLARSLAQRAATIPNAELSKSTRHILNRASYLVETVNRLITADLGQLTTDDRRTIRHELRGSAAFIVSASEDLLESLPPEQLVALEPDLSECLRSAHRIIKHVENILTLGSPTDHPTRIRGAIESLSEQLQQMAGTADRTLPGRVLIVDDNEFNRHLVGKMLTNLGHAVEAVDGGKAAQARLIDTTAPAIDAILLDVMMPEITGIQLLQWLKANPVLWPIPVIMVSALEDDKGVWACISAGAEDYLTRPLRPELLRARLAGGLEKKRLRDREQMYLARIDRLVNAIFPPAAVDEWRANETIRPKRHEKIGVLFLDIVGFTAWCEARRDNPEEIVATLQELVVKLEATTHRHGVQKIKTIGDAFMAVTGLSDPDPTPAKTLLRCGRELIQDVRNHHPGWTARVGIHIGPVVTGVLGQTQFSFDVWGHTVNAAARMESNGKPGFVTLSAEAWEEVRDVAQGTPREVMARGLGTVTVWDVEAA